MLARKIETSVARFARIHPLVNALARGVTRNTV